MSVRGYKVTNIQRSKEATFNLWHDNWVLDFASHTYLDQDAGFVEFYVEDIINGIKKLKQDKSEEWEEKVETLNNILKDFGEEEYILYDCY